MANILAIDDEIPILELIKNGLQKDGHTVSTYPSVSQIPLLSNCSELRVCMYTINHSFFKASTKTIRAYYERDRRNFITKS